MRVFIILILLILVKGIYAQDLDIYKVDKNSNFDIPRIPKMMTYEEFKILSSHLRMQDMVIATVLPGHVHFKIGEKKTGYYILGARSLGYAGWAYLSLTDKSLSEILLLNTTGLDINISKSDIIISYASLALIVGSYLYDWIHGKYVLDEKQNRIRYKYAKKRVQLGFSNLKIRDLNYPGLSLTYNF